MEEWLRVAGAALVGVCTGLWLQPACVCEGDHKRKITIRRLHRLISLSTPSMSISTKNKHEDEKIIYLRRGE